MKKGKKKGLGKKILKIIGIILAVIIGLIAVFAIFSTIANIFVNKKNTEYAKSFQKVEIENQLIPEKDENGNWTFTTDREMKILQFTDVHIGGGWLSAKNDVKALNAVAKMITEEKPDLVVVTGDIAYPVPYDSASINNEPPATIFMTLMESLGVYWVPTFGNHDSEFYSTYDRAGVSEIYSNPNYKYCLYEAGPEDIYGYGNSVINVKNSQGIITQSLFAMDSNAYTGETLIETIAWEYDNIHDDQIAWYKSNVEAFTKYNTELINNGNFENKDEFLEKYDTPKSLVFFHIPLEEYRMAWYEYAENGFSDTENVKLVYGTVGEEKKLVYSSDISNNFFETMVELGSTQGIFCGHDHFNNFSLEYKGIRLTYGKSIDYIAYAGIHKIGTQRGCTVITLRPDGSFDCKCESYYQDKYNHEAREDVTMQEMVTVLPEKEE